MEKGNSVQELKEQFNQINQEKEKYFKEKESLKKQIISIIQDVKKIKFEKDDSSINLKELKNDRDFHNKKVKELIEKIKLINDQKRELSKKNDLKENPSKIKELINSLEMKIETEALTLNQEKKEMKEIKDLKKRYDKLGEINELTKNMDYSLFKEKSMEIEELKKKQQEAFNKFVEYKAKSSMMNNQIKSKEEHMIKVKEDNKKKKEEIM